MHRALLQILCCSSSSAARNEVKNLRTSFAGNAAKFCNTIEVKADVPSLSADVAFRPNSEVECAFAAVEAMMIKQPVENDSVAPGLNGTLHCPDPGT